MTEVGESSSVPASSRIDKPVVVRVKRKAYQSSLEAFWLEISGRPLKRPLIDFEKLSVSGSSSKEELKTRRVFMHHVDTVSSSEATIDVLQSFAQLGSDDDSKFKAKNREQRHTFKKENIRDLLLSKARKEQEILAKNARFEQIWRSRRANKEAVSDESVDEVFHLYDVVRVDDEEMPGRVKVREEMSVEDQEALSKILPLMKEFIPAAAEDIESDIRAYVSGLDLSERKDEYVYDLYTVLDNIDESDNSLPFPLVHVDDEDDFYDGPDHSDYETDDSNAENHPFNDYPEEISSEEGEKSETLGSESENSESDSRDESEDIDRWVNVNKRADRHMDCGMDNDYYEEEDDFDSYMDDGNDDGKDLRGRV